ncbi:hypothetical protein Sta7437_3223 [Stanieria cyanosphaera PCC 7437]|uniref:Uncharacterized protein n=1 Tax=Stanieria cyanosphaera (strain ATCC 29371 / PCC 7437) TaxID=111780 RepID=K9XVW3_STAC7|nr:hypothetical protein [Stanieria cyanosphaera]AFZ36730.1 hypothetical protein Sta7437_3223 [Stanieria cyanosphaera PCC 7437]
MNKVNNKIIGLIYLPFLLLLIGIGLQKEVSVKLLVRDIFSVVELPSYTSIVSNLGILFWCSAFTVCWFSYLLFKNYLSQKKRGFLLYSSAISLFLLLDDFFLLHERFYSSHFHLPEKLLFCIYVIIFINYLFQFRSVIVKTQYSILLLAMFFFAISFSLDLIEERLFPPPQLGPDLFFLIEDGSKFLGIIGWCLYLTSVGLLSSTKIMSQVKTKNFSPKINQEEDVITSEKIRIF